MNKNIAFAHVNYPDGGAETVTSYISSYLISKGYRVTIFAVKITKEKLIDCQAATNIIKLPNENLDTKENADFIIEKIKEYDISFIMSKDIIENMAYIRTSCAVKFIYTFHSVPLWECMDIMEYRKGRVGTSFSRKIEWWLLRYPKYKFFANGKKQRIRIYKMLYENADYLTVLCEEYGRQTAKLIGVNYAKSKFVVLQNPNIEATEPINIDKKKQVLYVGRLTYNDKRVDRLIDIWSLIEKDFPDWELLIVGAGEQEENLKAQAVRLELRNCKFCGYTTNVPNYLQNGAILCLTSAFEGWGLSLTEAQKYGVVPCAFGCSAGVKTILSPDGVNGVIVKCFDTKEYARRLAELMRNDDLRRQMQLNVIEKSKNYDIEIVGRKWEEMFEGKNKTVEL